MLMKLAKANFNILPSRKRKTPNVLATAARADVAIAASEKKSLEFIHNVILPTPPVSETYMYIALYESFN